MDANNMTGERLRVVVICETSGHVRDAFRELGHDAISCDLLPTDAPGPHHQGDAREILKNGGDILIAFPTCTYLCSSGMHWTTRGRRDPRLTEDALDFVRLILSAPFPHIALENPVGVISTRIRKPDQIIQPWQFGHPESKATCLWLKDLPTLKPTNVCEKPPSGRWLNQTPTGQNKLGPSATRWKERSKTYQGIAVAMAKQWSAFVLNSRMNANHGPIAENLFAWSIRNTTQTVIVSAQATPKNSDMNSKKSTENSTQYVNLPPDAAAVMFALSRR